MLIDIFISKKGKEKKITSTIINANIGERKNWHGQFCVPWFGC